MIWDDSDAQRRRLRIVGQISLGWWAFIGFYLLAALGGWVLIQTMK